MFISSGPARLSFGLSAMGEDTTPSIMRSLSFSRRVFVRCSTTPKMMTSMIVTMDIMMTTNRIRSFRIISMCRFLPSKFS